MDWTLYWFMFPISIGVATVAMLSGIGGAALFTPIFLIIFPLLGPEYPLASSVAAIGSALFIQAFGFSSGFVGYYRRGLIDFRAAVPFILVAVPLGIIGALSAHEVDQFWLKAAYAALMMVLFIVLLRRAAPIETIARSGANGLDDDPGRPMRSIVARDGTVYRYRAPRQGKGVVETGIGALMTGIASVGIGEVIMPQLVRRNRVPIEIAAATSVLIAIVTVACASIAHIWLLIAGGGFAAVPWSLIFWTVPGVIIGGQIGPRLQGKVAQRMMEKAIAILFGIIGVAMAWLAYGEFML